MELEPYNIFILNVTNNIWQEIATLNDNIVINMSYKNQVSNLIVKICASINEMERSKLMFDDNKRRIFVGVKGNKYNERIEFTFIGDMRYRNGTIYYGLQHVEQTNKTRFLIFGTNESHHGGAGTNPILHKSIETIINESLKGLIEKFTQEENIDINDNIKMALNTGTYIVGI
jgi:hypothetical protein